ncbi:MAG TPA: SIS domain-containing protein [Acidimicrobiales bacterium]|nr:SIS domain-containing protein [Acidimicrobiales bacterium]
MCGIIAVLRGPEHREILNPGTILPRVSSAVTFLRSAVEDPENRSAEITQAADLLAVTDRELRTVPGIGMLVFDRSSALAIEGEIHRANDALTAIDQHLDHLSIDLEHLNSSLLEVRDSLWAIGQDRLRTAEAVLDLAGGTPEANSLPGLMSVQTALSALDRLEVRGRDSAGIEIFVTNHNLPPSALEGSRFNDAILRSGAIRDCGDHIAFVYKNAAEIGDLGDNTNIIRAAIRRDELLQEAIAGPESQVTVLGHTRWASVGVISEANAHPVDSQEGTSNKPYVSAVVNGDIDNYMDLTELQNLDIAPEITTDAKIVPTLISKQLVSNSNDLHAFRTTVSTFEGSMAIASHNADQPHKLSLALRGSGQAIYVGIADNSYVVASEPYGVVEDASQWIRMDGEKPADPQNPISSAGQIIQLDATNGGDLQGITRVAYDGTELPVQPDEIATADITTRDIDRGDAPHFLLKEIQEAPQSVHKTLRGRIIETADKLQVDLGPETIPATIHNALTNKQIKKIIAIGQGTAAVAARTIPQFLRPLIKEQELTVEAQLATELSGFSMATDMSDTLVVAVSQSGTTTDTNRTVDLIRQRGGHIIAIVNRRGSDLADKSHGVLYTSDGRDVEMSVASTKAFYAQVVAGVLLSSALANLIDTTRDQTAILSALRQLPKSMEQVLATRPSIAMAAQRHAPQKRYWAVVGNGPNRIAANEIRIKLSELCYKAIPEDGTEDKKHIDLSSEPLIFVCAAGLSGSNIDDVAKEVAIYRAHKAIPIVVASENESRFEAAAELLTVPQLHPSLDFILATIVGHLFGYEAALAIDHQALPLRQMRSTLETIIADGTLEDGAFERLQDDLAIPGSQFLDGLRGSSYDGHLEASTAAKVVTILRYAMGIASLDSYQIEVGKVGRPGVVIDDLNAALTKAIDELTRPVDAIKHQAKTVTVGISRSDETLLQSTLAKAALEAGTPRDRLSYRELRTLVALDASVAEVTGWTRYRIEGDVTEDATIQVIDRGGIASGIASRTDTNPILRGGKHRAAFEKEIMVGVGSDGRNVIHIPEVKDNETTGLTLLHCRFHDYLPTPSMRAVLQGYRGRYGALEDAVTESHPSFRDDILSTINVVDLLTRPVYVLAEHWTS